MKAMWWAAGLLLVLGLLPAGTANSQQYLDWEHWLSSGNAVKIGQRGAFRINLGVGAGSAPIYLGSDEFEFKPLVLADLDYRGVLFLSAQRGLGYNFIRRPRFRLGPRLTVDYGRDSGESDRLTGLPDIDPGVEIGIFGEYFTGSWRVRGEIRQEIADGHGGLLASFEFAHGRRVTRQASVFVGANFQVMDQSYGDALFGVAPANATPSRRAYSPDTGLRDIGAFIQVVFDLSERFYVSFDARGSLLIDQAADSPLTDEDKQWFAGAIVGARF